MATISNFIYCMNSEVDNNNNFVNINGLMSAMTPEYIPGLFSFSIVFSLLDLEEREHVFDVKFRDPYDNEIASINHSVIDFKGDPVSNLPKEYIGLNITGNFQNVNLKMSGMYATEILLDGMSLGTFNIYVKGKNEG